MRIYYWLRAKFQRWNYKRKYGISVDEAMLEYGKHVIISEKLEE